MPFVDFDIPNPEDPFGLPPQPMGDELDKAATEGGRMALKTIRASSKRQEVLLKALAAD